MKKYEKYKDSGVEWLGEIPEHWRVTPLKRIVEIVNGSTPSTNIEDYWDGDITWVTPVDIQNEKYIFSSKRFITTKGLESCGTSIVPRGSVILTTRAPIGKLAIANVDLCTNQGCKSLICRKINNEYLYYFLLCNKEVLESFGAGSTFKELSSQSLANLDIVLPLISDQQQIVVFLGSVINKTNQLITEKESLITKLQEKRKALINEVVTKGLNPNAPMRDSGIEWLGMIPEHWKCFNFRYIIDILTDFTANGSFGDLAKNVTYLEEGYSRLVRLTDLRENLNNKGIYVSKKSHDYLSKSSLYGDEILLANVGAYAGLACLMPKIDYPATLGPNMFLLKFNTNVNNKFIYYALLASSLSEHLINKAISSAQPKLNKEDVRSCIVILPSLSDQAQIVEFIESRTTKIDEIVSETQLQIQKLKEYKTAVISEVVTGKVDVREWKTPNP